MDSLWTDVRYAFRVLRKSPGYTFVAVLTLALGIGANTAIFSVVNAMLLRPMPAEDPDRLVVFGVSDRQGNLFSELSYPNYVDFRDRSQGLSGILGHKLIHVALSDGRENELVWGELVTGNYFDVLGVRPALGRGFVPEEDRTPGSHPVAVISHKLWQRRFNADPGIVGKTVTVNGKGFTVVGVAPREFQGTEFALALDIWVPMMMHDQVRTDYAGIDVLNQRGSSWIETMGRLAPGTSIPEAEAALNTFAAQLVEEYDLDRQMRITLFPEARARMGLEGSSAAGLAAALLMGVVALVLLVACANVANLLLARASVRQREIGIRLALGARRGRLVRQLLTESVLLALAGGVAGLLLALWVTGVFTALMPPMPYPVGVDVTPDAKVLAYTLGLSLLTGVVFGIVPALHASKPDFLPLLKSETPAARGAGRRLGFRDALVAVQLAVSLVLLVGAGLLARSLQNAQALDSGFGTQDVLLASVDLGVLGSTEEEGRAFYRQLVERVGALPGVKAAALVDLVPLGDSSNSSGPVIAEGKEPQRDEDLINVGVSVATPRHFEALGIRLLAGRDFAESDGDGSPPVIIINETLAERFWPGESAVGKRLRIGRSPSTPMREVIGVVSGGKYRTLGESPRPYMYLPLAQSYTPQVVLLARTEADPAAQVAAVRREVQALAPRLPVYGVKTLPEHLGHALWPARAGAATSAAMSLLALLLATVGLYGVMAYSVAQRTREIGVRMALGARPRDVLRLVVGRGLWLALAGVAAGVAAAFGVTRLMAGLLYGVDTADPWTFAGVALGLLGVALLASYIPARRAALVDPAIALRHE
jgi:predicted permease